MTIMAKRNEPSDSQELDAEHELPSPHAGRQGERRAAAPGGAEAPEAAESGAPAPELQQLRQERDLAVERLARAQAEFENARRRAQREQQEYRDYALAEAVRMLLPILDSFDRALASGSSNEDFRAGMELIDRQIHGVLAKLGVTEIAAESVPFDPTIHEAIEMVDSNEVPDHHILKELQRGYRLKGRLLRPAMVRVARNPGK
jgi:molecular chaperone GrpE